MEASQVREIFDYDPLTGVLRWKIQVSRHKIGDVAGLKKAPKGRKRYMFIRYEGKWYLAHRLAFAIMEGRWPDPEVDHENTDGWDNRWLNLREATKAQNAQNRKMPITNKVGMKGVIRVARFGVTKFEARIRVSGKQKHLGRFDTAQEAHAAYCNAADKHFGDFARTH